MDQSRHPTFLAVLRKTASLLVPLVLYCSVSACQHITDVVAPVNKRTLVDVIGSRSAQLSIQKNAFEGSAELLSDPQSGHSVVDVIPDNKAKPAEISVVQNTELVQRIRVFPVSVGQEEWPLKNVATPPDPTSRDYAATTKGTRQFNGIFNGQVHSSLGTIQVSGYRVVIQPGSPQGVYERLMPGGTAAKDVGTVEIFAKELIIAAPLKLPGATVKIYAESVEFLDQQNSISLIDVTPDATGKQIPPDTNGAIGQSGGDVFLYVSRPVTESAPGQKRFILRGAVGQQGVEALIGDRGTPLVGHGTENLSVGGIVSNWNNIEKVGQDSLPLGWGGAGVVWLKRGNRMEFGQEGVWPENGNPGHPGGIPGVGGPGGNLHSTISVPPTMVDATGGASGAPQGIGPGGPAGTPNPAVGIWIEPIETCSEGSERHPPKCTTKAKFHFFSHASSPGPPVPSPGANLPQGPDGNVSTELRGWLHPFAARATLGFAEDLYRMGLLTDAQEKLTALVSASATDESRTGPEQAYVTVRQRTEALLARLSSNLDYFGNPAGWVPVVDFASTIKLLTTEVNSIGPILVVTEQIHKNAEEGKAKAASLQTSRNAAVNQIKQMESRLNDLAADIPKRQQDSREIAQEQVQLLVAIQLRDSQLSEEATDKTRTSFLKQAFRTLGAVASVFPIGQPILGTVGGALNFVSSIDEHTPWESIQSLPSVVDGFSKENITASVQRYQNVLSDVKSMDPSNPKQLFSEISSAAGAVGKSLAQFQKLQEGSRVPASEVDGVLQQLKAQDASLNDLTQKVAKLSAKKEALAQKLDHAIHEFGDLTSEIGAQTERMDSFNRALVDVQDLIDHPGILAAKEIGRSLRKRLDSYHYLFIKSYEYYSAQPYQGNLRAAGTAESMLDILNRNNGDATLAATAYVTAYREEVLNVGSQIVQQLVQEGSGTEKKFFLELNPNELETLNQMLKDEHSSVGDLFVNLEDRRGLMPVTDLEARLLDVKVLSCDCKKVSGPPASAHIEVDVRSTAEGVIRTATQNLKYRLLERVQPWGATIDLTNPLHKITQNKVPENVGRVLSGLLGIPPPQSFLTAPPAYPGIHLRVGLSKDNNDVQAEIGALQLQLTYSFRPGDGRGIRVVTSAAQGDEPFFYVGLADARQLQHGLGSFTRFYTDGSQLEIIASPTFGNMTFGGWYLKGNLVSKGAHLIVPAANDTYFYEARYKNK